MSGWWHPEGPESVATYWSRRFVVIAAAALALVLGIVLVTTGAQGSEPGTAAPAADPSGPAGSPTPFAAPTPSGTPSASGTPSRSATPSAAGTSTPSASGTPGAGTSRAATPDSSTSSSPSGAPSSSSSSPSGSASTAAAPTPCAPAELRATLQGNPTPEVGQRVVLTLSLINGSDRACTFKQNADTVELKVYSGTDRIWSTADCAARVRPAVHVVQPEGAVEWKIAWDGARSATGCRARPETPRPGTYFATFQFAGAKPVQQRMVLTAS